MVLATDVSPYGLGGVVMQRYPDESELPVAYASRALSATENTVFTIGQTGSEYYFWSLEV